VPDFSAPVCAVFPRDPRLFFIHSRWRDEAVFDAHADLPHTLRFLGRVGPVIDQPLDVTRATIVVSGRRGARPMRGASTPSPR